MLLITDSYQTPLNLPLWYLSAMMFVLPLYVVFVQIRNRYAIMYISFVYSVMFYGLRGVTGDVCVPYDELRVLAGLMLGALGYEISNLFLKEDISKKQQRILMFVEEGALCLAALSMILHLPIRRVNLILLFIGITILASGKSFSNEIKIALFVKLGGLSIYIYIWHWVIGSILKLMIECNYLSLNKWSIVIYYSLTLIVAMVYNCVAKVMKNPIRKIQVKLLGDL